LFCLRLAERHGREWPEREAGSGTCSGVSREYLESPVIQIPESGYRACRAGTRARRVLPVRSRAFSIDPAAGEIHADAGVIESASRSGAAKRMSGMNETGDEEMCHG
jgi:hypothetical protein